MSTDRATDWPHVETDMAAWRAWVTREDGCLHGNGHGRRYALCLGCDANVIDLPPDRACAERVIRNFFGWDEVGGLCPACRSPIRRRVRRYRHSARFRGPITVEERT